MKLFRRKTEEEAVRQEIAVKEAAPFEGLTEAEAAARAAAGWDNRPVEPPTRTTGQIVRENLLTYFNLVFLVLALCLVAVKASILNLSFVIVVIINAVIGIVQELRSKSCTDISSVEYGILETDGTLNVILFPAERPATAGQLGISTADGGYPSIVINDGRVIDTNLQKLGLDRSWLSAELKRQGRGSEKDIFLMTVNQRREVYISVKEAQQ